ncbi:translation initiation factor IF-2 [Desulfatitalea alkaliphila]|uniref:Translation initiation factor IF-2 n=1 Tax=Desulfatitalea alkaliphila TaxID=2929485 RepID=A0AA41UL66_9BACT|nr:translation initiation factor IF-2 [Desulfatitalea alkaliphila]MCJ8501151.1 translation initiation factor IF-2 [Desulfatitalea alkaliphila]
MTQPKKRVYELARELNMTNKDLLEKISSLDLGLNSHMSALDETHEAKIRQLVQGGPEPDLEEKRVKPTVIRRRRKAMEAEPDTPAAAETEAPAETATGTETTAEAPAEPPAAAEAPSEETAETPATEEATPSEKPAAKSVRRKKEETAARVIARPPVPEAAEPVQEPSEAAPETPSAEAPEPPAETLPTETEVEAPVSETTPTETTEPVAPVESVESPEASETSAEVPAAKEEAPKPKAKKKKKEAAAKIIKLPERPPAPPESEPEPEVPTAPAAMVETEAPKSDRPKKKGKKKTEVEEESQDKKFLKKKISFRKKEVVEGADLYSDRGKGRKGRKGGKAKSMPATQKTQITTAKAIKRRIRIDDTIVLSDLAKRMGIKAGEMIARLMSNGVMVTVNQTIDFDTATLVAAEFGYEVEKAAFEEETILHTAQPDDPENLSHRPPVVTIMGHVDHGKTSLLDVIRKSRVTAGEAGGITQHIGAYLVSTDKGHIAFLDTPGHEAFSAMRSRGAHITDIVILVVAADDGVMPQTVEAINHAKAAKVPVIVAVNKMDKPDADPDRVQRQLAEIGVTPEAWGGDTIFVHVSAKQETGIDELMEMILLQAEVLELKANPDKLASGHVVEAKLDSGRGPVATVLVKEGTLKTGDPVVCGVHHGKVRALIDDRGRKVDQAGPSHPVELIGLSGVPMAGDEMVALKDEKDAKQVGQHRFQKQRAKELAKTSRLSLDKLYERMQEGEVKELNVIIKADVDGSMEAIRDSLVKLSNEEVAINVMHAATGTITESDISLAAVSEAIIIGFNVRPNPKVQDMANEENVDIRYHNIIYNVIKEIKDAIVGLMKSTFEERFVGRAEVREVFHVPKVGAIAGCYVTDGKIERGKLTRLLRDGVVIYDGKNSSLKRYKDDAKEVQSGYECGIGLENYNDIKVGDIIETYYIEEIRPEVE